MSYVEDTIRRVGEACKATEIAVLIVQHEELHNDIRAGWDVNYKNNPYGITAMNKTVESLTRLGFEDYAFEAGIRTADSCLQARNH